MFCIPVSQRKSRFPPPAPRPPSTGKPRRKHRHSARFSIQVIGRNRDSERLSGSADGHRDDSTTSKGFQSSLADQLASSETTRKLELQTLLESNDRTLKLLRDITRYPRTTVLLTSLERIFFDEARAIKQVVLSQLGLSEDEYAALEQDPQNLPFLDLNASVRLNPDSRLLPGGFDFTHLITVSGQPLAS